MRVVGWMRPHMGKYICNKFLRSLSLQTDIHVQKTRESRGREGGWAGGGGGESGGGGGGSKRDRHTDRQTESERARETVMHNVEVPSRPNI